METARIHRRHFLIGSASTAGAIAAAGVTGSSFPAFAAETKELPDYVSWKDADKLIMHTEQTLEMKRGAGGTSVITPNEEVYIRNNLPSPDESIVADRDAWEVSIEGVNDPRTLTVGELKNIGIETVATVLQCSGNGRGFYEHETSGSQWLTGAAGCILWSGVPVRKVVEELGGLADGGNFMTSTGGEQLPEGVEEKDIIVERSVPAEAMENAILAWEMNGDEMPLAHGGPLRMIVPGYYGINNVKYVKRVAFTEEETDAKIQASGYRVRPVGVDGAPDQPSMWEMQVKSWVTHPLKDSESGRVQIYGVAFGGDKPVEKVEVSLDGGESWQDASFIGPDLGRFAWRPFLLTADLEPGDYVITSRATDSDGNVQPESTEPNHRGYDYNGWDRLAVEVTVV
ncbi:sulfite oxidase [Fodinicurvata halophila]|uniref:Sulfite oxidase n=1 Tax=Fodinicurvata halophila TaxID=1419723 RepID=A0ABV8US87_9PROT